jgi:hypothetical protein
MTDDDTDLDPVSAAMIQGCIKYIGAAIEPLKARIAELEAKQSRPVMRFAGPWRRGDAYQAGDCCVYGGALWHCNSVSILQPGSTPDFTLCVKKGAAG